MLLRRIKAHIEKENWFAVFIDFVIVVFGVFIGIQVANWNASRENERIADGYIERLQKEIRIENENLQHVFDYFSVARTHGVAALEGFKLPTPELESRFLIDLYQASQTWNYRPSLSTYNELLATGRISLISNENIRKAVSGYFLGRASSEKTIEKSTITPFRANIRSYMDNDIQMQIREICGDTFLISKNNNTYLQLPETCVINISEDLAKSEISQLHANATIRRDLTFHIGEIDVVLASLANGINAGNATLAILDGTTP